jgi:hypothetical protein
MTLLDETAASIGVVVGQLLLDLGVTRRQPLLGIDANLVFAGGSAETGHVRVALETLLGHAVVFPCPLP